MTIESIGLAYIFLIGLFLVFMAVKGTGMVFRWLLWRGRSIEGGIKEISPVETPGGVDEKRRSVRVEARGYITAKTSVEKDGKSFQVANISLGGVLMKTSTKFKIGETIELDIQLPFSPESVKISAKVTRVDMEGARHLANRFSVAAQFLSVNKVCRQKLTSALETLVEKAGVNV